MTDEEKTYILRFIQGVEYNAVKKFFDLYFGNKSLKDFTLNMNNENLGASVRARVEAMGLVDSAFKEMEKLQPDSPQKLKINEAR